MALRQTPVDARVRKITAARVRFKYGQRRRAFLNPDTKRDVAAGGTLSEAFITLPKKAWLVGGGLQSAASDVVLATGDGFQVRTADGTILGTCYVTGDYTLGSGRATTVDFETGTFVATNKPLIIRIPGTRAGQSGSVYFFVDYEPSDRTALAE